MKKILAGILAGAMLLSLNISAFAAVADNESYNLTAISGKPVYDTGKQFTDALETVSPDQTIYFALPTSLSKWLSDSKNYKLSTKKGTNSKLIKSITLTEKRLSSSANSIEMPNVKTPNPLPPSPNTDIAKFTSNQRLTYLAVTLNDTTSADELKTTFTATFSVKKLPSAANATFTYGDGKGTPVGNNVFFEPKAVGDKLELTGTIYVGNPEDSGDASVTVGKQGIMIKPDKNADNEIVFESDDTLATLTFRSSSNPKKFLAKLSTNWTSTLVTKFRDTDAVIRAFSPATIDSTSRATLALNNPFDDDINPKKVYIYTADSKGNLTDITKTVTYNSDDDAFVLKTRTLTTYIISDTKVKTK